MMYRVEKDSLGYKKIPSESYFGIHTERSKEVFTVSGRRIHLDLFLRMALFKIAAVKANMELKLLDKKKGSAIIKASQDILYGKFHDQFVVDIFQAGAGTSTHMNVNEVIANRAIELLGGQKGDYEIVHPLDHVNMAQSTNNVFPTAIKISSYFYVISLIRHLKDLQRALFKKAKEFKSVLKSGRTHLQDAGPITLGQEFHAYGSSLGKDIERLEETLTFLVRLNTGGTAIGTGINTHPHFSKKVLHHLTLLTHVNWKEARDPIEATQNVTDFLVVSDVLKIIAVDLIKICNDFRLLNSGPVTGLREISLPAIEPGSSIMPGKINPSIAEMMTMICYQIIGYNEAISYSVQAGQLELNVMMPLIGHDLLESFDLLQNGLVIFTKKCVDGIVVHKDVCRYYFEHSAGLATLLNPYLGYDRVAWIVKESLRTGETIQEIVLRKKLLDKEQLARIFDYNNMTRSHLKKLSKPF